MYDTGQTKQAMLDATYSRPDVPWGALVLLLIWCAVEGTIFAYAVSPTIGGVISDLAGFNVNPIVLIVLLSIFLTILIAGIFASLQELQGAIKGKNIGNILSQILVQAVVAMMQVLFLYRELVDAITPWLAQRQGVILGVVGTMGLAVCAWVAVRGMTWYLFGRSGAPALIAVLSRHAGTHH